MIGGRIVILGFGESGIGSALLAKKMNCDIFVSDKNIISESAKKILQENHIKFEEHKHSESKIITADLVIKSPGIPDNIPIIKILKTKSIPVISEIEFAFRHSKSDVIAITGSNGKTTTASLIYHLLKDIKSVALAGNIGYSYARSVAEIDTPLYVLEVSSFQLDGIFEFKPHIAVITNITPDHLEYYDNNFETYTSSKFKIMLNQTHQDYLIYDADDSVITSYMKRHPIKAKLVPFSIKKQLEYGIYLENNKLIINMKKPYTIPIQSLPLEGKHNYKNTMAAIAATEVLKIDKTLILESFKSFQGIAHRLEFVEEISHVQYTNDSKATNVNATYYALESMKRPTIWIVGGVDKGNDYSELTSLVRQKVKAIICLGVDNTKIIEQFKDVVAYMIETRSMKEAVNTAYGISKDGDSVLLSPACSSFDLFKNYEDRGTQFKNQVRKLIS